MTLLLLCIAVAISFTFGYILGAKEYAKENLILTQLLTNKEKENENKKDS